MATSATTVKPSLGNRGKVVDPSRVGWVAVGISTEASSSMATGSTGICHTQSNVAVPQNAKRPATAAANWGRS